MDLVLIRIWSTLNLGSNCCITAQSYTFVEIKFTQEVLWLANGNLKKLFTWKVHPHRVSSGALASFIVWLARASQVCVISRLMLVVFGLIDCFLIASRISLLCFSIRPCNSSDLPSAHWSLSSVSLACFCFNLPLMM